MKRYIAYIAAASAMLVLHSCKAWLNVDSEDRILEERLYSSTDGFYTALNGVYIDLVNENLYSGTLAPAASDIMAQYYDTNADTHTYGSLAGFQNEAKRNAVSGLWTRAYFLILNINKIIARCDERKGSVLNETDYNLIKGECLALRALLHFELLRYFGPVFSVSPGADAIPYMTDPDPKVGPVLPATAVMSRLNADLEESMGLLAISDPVISSGKNDVDNGGRNLYGFRNLRMNYFATKALAARVNMYLGYLENYRAKALQYAEEVIRDAAVFFPFSTREEANGQAATGNVNTSSEDRVLSSDILFSVYNVRRGEDIYEKYFYNTLEINRLLAISERGYNSMFPEEGDLRTFQWARKKDALGNDVICLVKYEAMEVDGKSYPYMIPVLRMAEMYLIAAECHNADGNTGLAYQRLNTLRNARQTSSVNTAIEANIEYEYIREFAGEGQLFWYYKRKNAQTITAIYDRSRPDISIGTEGYLFELPQAEDGFRDKK
ncbi:MAG: RagB/SusD family nutrient uptake outer membrane protein [Bacteroidales bacterium]|nr:RagB/SusD family nutrient uptake outer membrane protein [Bacteroidales bacterium]